MFLPHEKALPQRQLSAPKSITNWKARLILFWRSEGLAKLTNRMPTDHRVSACFSIVFGPVTIAKIQRHLWECEKKTFDLSMGLESMLDLEPKTEKRFDRSLRSSKALRCLESFSNIFKPWTNHIQSHTESRTAATCLHTYNGEFLHRQAAPKTSKNPWNP